MFSKKQILTIVLLSAASYVSSAFWSYVDPADLAAIEITQDDFEKKVLQSDLPVIVDVYVVWCFPCQILKPMFAQVAKEFKNSCKMLAIDYEKNNTLTSTLGIERFPTMLVYNKGNIIGRFEGLPESKEVLEDFVRSVVGSVA